MGFPPLNAAYSLPIFFVFSLGCVAAVLLWVLLVFNDPRRNGCASTVLIMLGFACAFVFAALLGHLGFPTRNPGACDVLVQNGVDPVDAAWKLSCTLPRYHVSCPKTANALRSQHSAKERVQMAFEGTSMRAHPAKMDISDGCQIPSRFI